MVGTNCSTVLVRAIQTGRLIPPGTPVGTARHQPTGDTQWGGRETTGEPDQDHMVNNTDRPRRQLKQILNDQLALDLWTDLALEHSANFFRYLLIFLSVLALSLIHI